MDAIEKQQREICIKYKAIFHKSPFNLKVGISKNIKEGKRPINGLRHQSEGDTTGWYLWAGDFSDDANFFIPLHIEHIKEYCPFILKYLGLPPGYRFIASESYEDIWEDKLLLNLK